MQIASLIKPSLVFPQIEGDKGSALRQFADQIAVAEGLDAEEIFLGLCEREELGSTAIGNTVAIPHCRVKDKRDAIVAVGVSPGGIDFDAKDEKPVRLFFVIVSPRSDPSQNLRCLAAISRWVQTEGNVERVLAEPSPPAITALLSEIDSDL